MNILLYISGILIALLLLAGALALTVYCYLRYCSKHPMRKFRAEIFVVIMVFVASLAVRMAIGFVSLPQETLTGGAQSLLYGILSTVAGLTFDGPAELSDFELVNGILVCLYYGIIAYAGFVFLSVITVGVSYEFYSRVQTMFMRYRKRCSYYIFTSITYDSLVLAEDIKKHEQGKKGCSYVIIFFEKGEESFSRKNPLHRQLMQNGFYYYSDPRCTDNGETVSLLGKFKFNGKNCAKDDIGENHSKLFYVFAMDNDGDYEMYNADVIFDDMEASLKSYVYKRKGEICNALPTVLNYYILTSGDVNYESYERRSNEIIARRLDSLIPNDGNSNEERSAIAKSIDAEVQINVINEATLSSRSLVLARNKHLNSLGGKAFSLDCSADNDGAYRIAVIGFGMTGQYAMEELYTQTAKLSKTDKGYAPTQFIADIYDSDIANKSGQFAYNHPLFRCVDENSSKKLTDTKSIITKAKSVSGKAMEILYSECAEKTKLSKQDAKEFVDSQMAFPIAVMRRENAFAYPFLASEGAETAVDWAYENGIRDFVIALGNDEKNIEMANMLIDSFRRSFLKISLENGKFDKHHVKIYVNLIEKRNKALINWRWENDAKTFTRPYEQNEQNQLINCPLLSVVPFGYREEMYSYDSLIEDYRERIYNYGYNLLSSIISAKEDERQSCENAYAEFKKSIGANFDVLRNNEEAIDQWMTISQFIRLSNKSALNFAINYFKYAESRNNNLTAEDWDYMIRLEHERWDRFFIAHGWVYAKYCKFADFTDKTADEKKEIKKKEKESRREVKQHNCLCPFDEMLDEYTKAYDRGNVELGLIKGIVYGK